MNIERPKNKSCPVCGLIVPTAERHCSVGQRPGGFYRIGNHGRMCHKGTYSERFRCPGSGMEFAAGGVP